MTGPLPKLPPGTSTGRIEVGGSLTRWYGWGAGDPAVLLIHGGGANSGWWFDTVTHMHQGRRIVAMDLSGHGDSDPRPSYGAERWADEAEAVLESIGGRAVVVAHSMGGRVGTVLAARRPDLVAALALLDCIIPTHEAEPMPSPSPKRIYESLDAAVARFRLLPGSTTADEAARARLGRASVKREGAGWTWKFDPAVFATDDAELVNAAIPSILCPVVLVQAAESPLTRPEMAEDLAVRLGRAIDFRVLEGAGHHFMVDEPRRTAALLDEIVERSAVTS